MNAASHYRAAERLLRRCAEEIADGKVVGAFPAMANAHATLALAGATFLAGGSGYELAAGEFADVLIGADE
jgi:hypothetical protein